MDLRLERNLNVEIQVQPQTEGITLSLVASALLLGGAASYTAERTRRAVDEATGRVLYAVEREVVEGPLATPLLLLLPPLVALPLGRGIVLGFLAVGLVHLLLLLLAAGLLLVGAASGGHCVVWFGISQR